MRSLGKIFSAVLVSLFLLMPLTVFSATQSVSLEKPSFCINQTDEIKKVLSSIPSLNKLCLSNEIGCNEVFAAQKSLSDTKIDLRAGGIVDFEKYIEYCKNRNTALEGLESSGSSLNQGVIDSFGQYACVDSLSDPACSDNATNTDFKKLQDVIRAGYLVTFLEEPISSEPGTIFNRARICSTSFVRDAHGNLQKITTNSSKEREVIDPTNLYNGLAGKYAIEVNDCKTYLVEICKPSSQNLNYVELDSGGALNGGLPVVVYCDQIQVIYGKTGVDLLTNYVGFIYRWAAGIVGVIAVLVVLVSGIQISAANGDSAKIDEAKERITQSLVALALLFLSGVFLYVINPGFFVSTDVSPQSLPAVESVQQPTEDVLDVTN